MKKSSQPFRLAVATCKKLPEPMGGDASMLKLLNGVDVVAAPWRSAELDWNGFDAVLLRSCWDYHHDVSGFVSWVRELEARGTPVWNPSGVVSWNVRKTYLRELAEQGVPTIPTVWLEGEEVDSVRQAVASVDWEDVVLKPIVGASSFLTWRSTLAEALERVDRLKRLVRQGGGLLQPFVPEIVTRGEWSLIFVEGEFTHAVCKRAQRGEFRVQSEFGGSAVLGEPPPQAHEAAAAALALVPSQDVQDAQDVLYARVDGVETDHGFLICEVELIEPELFLDAHEEAARLMADAIEHRLRSLEPSVRRS